MTGKSESEAPVMGVSDYIEELKTTGETSVPDPHGMGHYLICLTAGSCYFAAKVIWVANDQKDPIIGRRAAPAHLRNKYGREILWYPKGLGVTYRSEGWDAYKSPDEYFLASAKMLLGFILAGRRLYMMACGQNINSLNTDDDLCHY